MLGRTIALYGLSGSGKTTQAGAHAHYVRKTTGKFTEYWRADKGGNDSIEAHIRVGTIRPTFLGEEENPWTWLGRAVTTPPAPDVGLRIIDSGTGIAEALLKAGRDAAARGVQIGSEKVYKQTIAVDGGDSLIIGANNKSQYGLIQTFGTDMIWKSTYLAADKGIDVLWTFGEHRGEDPNDQHIIGPAFAGKALTGLLPKWVRYTLRLVEITQPGSAPVHRLQLQAQPEFGGTGMSFANSRYPLEATTPLPPFIEPASLPEFWSLIESGQREADEVLMSEL